MRHDTEHLPEVKQVWLVWEHDNDDASSDDEGWRLGALRIDNLVIQVDSEDAARILQDLFKPRPS